VTKKVVERIRLSEGERDRLRTTNEVLAAAQATVARAEVAWKLVLGEVLNHYEVEEDKCSQLVLQDDMKYLVYEEKPYGDS
jgi:hypothetical protein